LIVFGGRFHRRARRGRGGRRRSAWRRDGLSVRAPDGAGSGCQNAPPDRL